MGYTVGTLYLVLWNLDELILRISARTLVELAATLQTVELKIIGPDTSELAMGQVFFTFALPHAARWPLVFGYTLPAGTPGPD